MHEIIATILDFSLALGYPGIIFLMTIESSFIPFPSEIVIPPAAYLAARGDMNLYLVIVSGVLGSLVGASINYWLARYLGRKFVYRIIDWKIFSLMLINSRKVHHSEKFFIKYGRSSTFIGRLVPAVRQLISLPAGFSRMNFGSFLLFTFIGSSIWIMILGFLGYFFGGREDLLNRYFYELKLVSILLFSAFILYLIIKKRLQKNA